MKYRLKTTLVVLVAALAFGALAAASASATLPEFNPRPTKIKPISFTIWGGEAVYHIEGSFDLSCREMKGTGSITTEKGGTVKLTFQKCKLGFTSCWTTGETGEIVTESLPFSLVYTKKEPTKEVAIAFNHKGKTFTTFRCGGSGLTTIRGAMLGLATPINTLTKSFNTALGISSEGNQTPRENYTENLKEMEKSFPEVSWAEGGFTEKFGLSSVFQFIEFKQSGAPTEVKIEA
jgi:hypothetical protein